MSFRTSPLLRDPLVDWRVVAGSCWGASSVDAGKSAPSPSIPTVSTADIARIGFFYAGGHYVGEPGKEIMDGAEYVEVMVPKKTRHAYPIVFLHGAGQTGTDWLQTPDGRPGWAYYFIKQGYVVYMVDYPARGRSAYVPSADGALTIRTAPQLEQIWTDLPELGNWPQAKKYTQWPSTAPNKGKMGDPVFDDFAKTQVQFLQGLSQDKLNLDAHMALLDKIGTPVILITHSQGGQLRLGDRRRPPQAGESDHYRRAGRSADSERGYGQAGLQRQRHGVGLNQFAAALRSARQRSLRIASGVGGESPMAPAWFPAGCRKSPRASSSTCATFRCWMFPAKPAITGFSIRVFPSGSTRPA